MTDQQQGGEIRGALRAARVARGLSQSEAARALVELGAARGAVVAAAASLKSLLSRWENGHAVPEQQYRELLAELYDRTPDELGLVPHPPGVPVTGPGALSAALAAARAAGAAGLDLWREQVELAHRIDGELGAAGAATVVAAQVVQLELALLHSIGRAARAPLAALLAEAACLQGAQLLDTADPSGAWCAFVTARSAADEAAAAGPLGRAVEGLAAVLVDIGEPRSAEALLDEEAPRQRSAGSAAWATARGLAAASAGDRAGSERWFDEAARSVAPTPRVDIVDVGSRFRLDVVDLDLRHGHALVRLDSPDAVGPLERALSAAPPTARDRAQLHADLAVALADERPADAASHARRARELAVRIGSRRTIGLLDATGGRP